MINKKIISGCIIVITLILLLPSIPAVHHNVVKDEILIEIPKDVELEDIKEILESKKLDSFKHPIMYMLIALIACLRYYRGAIFFFLAIDWDPVYNDINKIHNPILFLRGFWLAYTGQTLAAWFEVLSYKYGWNWWFPV